MGWTLHMIMCVLLCYPVSIRIYYQQGVLFLVKSCFANLRDLHRIRRLLSYDVSVMVSNALVSSRLDYCKSLFCSLSSKNITRLQNIHNCLARFVSGASRFSHVTPILSLSTGFLLNNESFSKPGYSYISTLPLASQNPLPHICLYTSAVKTKSPSNSLSS